MVLGNDSSTRVRDDHSPLSRERDGDGGVREDRVLAVGHRPAAAVPPHLGAEQRSVLLALVTHLMPGDDGASAQPAAVVRYIEYLIASDVGGSEVPLTLADVYRVGCVLVQEHSLHVFGRQVQDLSSNQQDQLVWDMLECSMDGFARFSPAYFFDTLRRHISDAIESGPISLD